MSYLKINVYYLNSYSNMLTGKRVGGGGVLLMDEKFSRRRGRGLLGCPILGEFPPCTIRKICAVSVLPM